MHRASLATLLVTAAAAGPAPAEPDLGAALAEAGRYGQLAEAFARAGLSAPEPPITLFAPTDAAFAALPPATADALAAPGGGAWLDTLLRAHVVPGAAHPADDLPGTMTTLSDDTLSARFAGGVLSVSLAGASAEARIVDPGISFAGGVAHGIDRVLLPEPGRPPPTGTGGGKRRAPGEPDAGADARHDPVALVPDRGGAAERIVAEAEFITPSEVTPRDAAPDASASEAGSPLRTRPVEPDEPRHPVELDAEIVARSDDAQPGAQGAGDGSPAAPEPRPASAGAETASHTDGAAENDAGVGLTRPVVSAADLLEQTVRDDTGREVGALSDLLVSLRTGRIVTVVIAADTGLLGLGDERTYRVDLGAISIDPLDGTLVVHADAIDAPRGR